MGDTKAIDRVLSDAVTAGQVPGVVAVAGNADGVLYQGAFGRRRLGGEQPMTMDTVFRIASMTKAITGAAAMQLVEQGRVGLDQPAEETLPFLADTPVLDGFDGNGKAILRPRKGTITLRNLLTHTAGFVYDTWNGAMNRYAVGHDLPAARTGRLAALSAPLGYDPGTRWEYGINIDMAGRMVDVTHDTNLEAYLRANVLGPLAMTDTSFVAHDRLVARLATVHTRDADGTLTPFDAPLPPANPEFYPGGGGLFSTAPDYLRFLRALMRGGEVDGQRVLKPK
jgi:CubicO group peptidase (beta-lactamase class C family)